jgi:hypothetical protein
MSKTVIFDRLVGEFLGDLWESKTGPNIEL